MNGQEIRAQRKSAGLTQRQLARKLGLGRTSGQVTISKWENDEYKIATPTGRLLQLVCAYTRAGIPLPWESDGTSGASDSLVSQASSSDRNAQSRPEGDRCSGNP